MKTNKIIDSIRNTTPTETNKQVDFCVAIANRIFNVMAEQGMKQRDLAKALGKTETEVSRWLSGTHNLTIATIAKIAAVLGDDIITTTTSVHPTNCQKNKKLPWQQRIFINIKLNRI